MIPTLVKTVDFVGTEKRILMSVLVLMITLAKTAKHVSIDELIKDMHNLILQFNVNYGTDKTPAI